MIDYSKFFTYSDGAIYWKVSLSNRVHVGMRAGTVTSQWYESVRIGGKKHQSHRIAWCLHNGEVPDGMVIDHIDGNKLNNKIENLRVVTTSENLFNAKMAKNNKSGITGVCWDKRRKSWMVCIGRSNLGNYKSFVKACEARIVAEVLNGKVTARHGT